MNARGNRVAPMLSLRAPAKINLAIDVGPRRADGYHEVTTVLQALTLHDDLRLQPAPDLRLACDDASLGNGPENLAWLAAERLRRAAGIAAGAEILLRKHIPARAGLGGGSSDAAAVLLGCNRIWELGWEPARLQDVAGALGADVPFFLNGGTALGRERGDSVTPLPPLPAWPIVVAQAGPGMETGAAYAALDAMPHRPHSPVEPLVALCRSHPREGDRDAQLALAGLVANSFEDAVLPQRPQASALRADLMARGALGASLCGSGSAIWGLAPSWPWACRCANALRQAGAWAVACYLNPTGVTAAARAARDAAW